MSVAITAGRRGIHDKAEVVRAAGQWLRSVGAEPFVVPAMGSHGGATAEGQVQLLADLGMTQETLGMPIRATMETVELDRLPDGPRRQRRLPRQRRRARPRRLRPIPHPREARPAQHVHQRDDRRALMSMAPSTDEIGVQLHVSDNSSATTALGPKVTSSSWVRARAAGWLVLALTSRLRPNVRLAMGPASTRRTISQ